MNEYFFIKQYRIQHGAVRTTISFISDHHEHDKTICKETQKQLQEAGEHQWRQRNHEQVENCYPIIQWTRRQTGPAHRHHFNTRQERPNQCNCVVAENWTVHKDNRGHWPLNHDEQRRNTATTPWSTWVGSEKHNFLFDRTNAITEMTKWVREKNRIHYYYTIYTHCFAYINFHWKLYNIEDPENCFVSPGFNNDESVETALDSRKLNKIIVKGKTAMPNIEELVSRTSKIADGPADEIWISTFDFGYSYGQLIRSRKARKVSIFAVTGGESTLYYRFLNGSHGVTDLLTIFQKKPIKHKEISTQHGWRT